MPRNQVPPLVISVFYRHVKNLNRHRDVALDPSRYGVEILDDGGERVFLFRSPHSEYPDIRVRQKSMTEFAVSPRPSSR